jgi:hypothetical protein
MATMMWIRFEGSASDNSMPKKKESRAAEAEKGLLRGYRLGFRSELDGVACACYKDGIGTLERMGHAFWFLE